MIEQKRRDQGGPKGYAVHTEEKKTVSNQTQGDTKESLLLQELVRLMRGQTQNMQQHNPPQAHFAQHDDFAGMNCASVSHVDNSLASWIVDTGATDHICADPTLFRNLIPSDLKSKTKIAIGKLHGNLYSLDNSSFLSSYISISCHVLNSCNSALWHRRLGHPSLPILHHIPEIKVTDSGLHQECDACPMAKLHRLPFPTHKIQSSTIFELVHVDVWGPCKIPSLTGCHYFLTVVDDFSRGLWTFLFKHKRQVTQLLDTFFKMVHTQFDTKVKIIRTDNGTEFLNAQSRSLFTSLGILHQTISPCTPQQNRVVERKHRHILEVARSLLFQSFLPKHFWGESILAATFLINRLLTALLGWKCPFEILYHKRPTLDQIRVFGCLYYAANTLPSKQKFDSRASKCIFLGYSQSQKAYKVYDIHTQTLFTSRDVVFHENIFPFQTNPPERDPIPLPLPFPEFISDEDVPAHFPTPTSIPDTHPSIPDDTSAQVPLRKSQRQLNKPVWLNDYVCNCISHTSSHCIPRSFAPAHISFVAQLSSVQEPRSYLQACRDEKWIEAMQQELQALERTGTWEITSLPTGKKTIGSRWLFKLKLHSDGTIDRYKARLVAKGYTQIEGVDYFDCFSPVAKSVSVRIFLAMATAKDWPILQLDINNAFLHGHLDEEVYMDPPEGYAAAKAGQVCRLRRSLYGLKQASRQWNTELMTKLLDFGFRQSSHDHCLFLKTEGSDFLALLVYVDDILLTGTSHPLLERVKNYLDKLFTIKDLGHAKYFLGLELARSQHGLHVSQSKFLCDILIDSGMLDCKTVSTPLPSGLRLSLDSGSLLPHPDRYRCLVGRLLYLGFTRPDISFAVQQLSQFLQHPRSTHWDAAMNVLRYLKGSPSLGLFFPSTSSLQLSAYSDASWASCHDSRRSVTGYCIFLGTFLVSWKTKK
ncbi:UNVERIFIED_CONTAM: Retrovirus-related Pol polyprotein from transposon RE2 [Sesamum latifolium]|uniref:Retrovirus-related Pol polyprotein from transposon RE2 n=1 Tax=Sesamum latifolium TaxID=2727402 RepID=A0AAW2TCH7_9LAMI